MIVCMSIGSTAPEKTTTPAAGPLASGWLRTGRRRAASSSSTTEASARATVALATHQSAPASPADRYARLPGRCARLGSRE